MSDTDHSSNSDTSISEELSFIDYIIIDWYDIERMNISIKTYFPDVIKISDYNPNMILLCRDVISNVSFNNENRLCKMISNNKGIVNDKPVKIFTKKISFIGEDYEKLLLFTNANEFGINAHHKNDLMYNVNSGANVEVFISFLVSRLSETNLCPSFNHFYNVSFAIITKFIYKIDTDDFENEEMSNVIQKCIKNNSAELIIDDEDDDINIAVKDHPCYLLMSEHNDTDLYNIIIDNSLKNMPDIVKSVLFQINAAIIIMYSHFKIKNNDLHTKNVMLQKTNIKHLYYTYNDTIYTIPTHGYLAKMIDWGRGTYEINNIFGYNNIYNSAIFEGFYKYKDINNIDNIMLPSNFPYSDIALLAHNILYEMQYKNIKKTKKIIALEKYLYKFIKCKDDHIIDIKKHSWKTYTDVLNKTCSFNNKYVLDDPFFKCYIVKSIIDKDSVIYEIPMTNIIIDTPNITNDDTEYTKITEIATDIINNIIADID